jgi:hypothetical protein
MLAYGWRDSGNPRKSCQDSWGPPKKKGSLTLKGRIYSPAALTISHSVFCIHEFCMILSLNGDYILEQHQPVDLCNGEVWCSLWGTDNFLKYYKDELRLYRVSQLTITYFICELNKYCCPDSICNQWVVLQLTKLRIDALLTSPIVTSTSTQSEVKCSCKLLNVQ